MEKTGVVRECTPTSCGLVSWLDVAAGFKDSPLHMKLFSLLTLTLALGLFAGCSANENKPAASGAASNDGEAFLAANAKKEGVLTTASGLEYKVIKSGTGESPKPDDKVKVHYHGTLIDGTVFDSSVQRGEPIVFPVGAVIPGWVEALQLMKVGDKWQLFIPAKLAYGEQSPTPAIPPNSVLIFEVELLGIEK
jgi:FKBP-type peptidyl-prolyl cis-trans isomerase FklB